MKESTKYEREWNLLVQTVKEEGEWFFSEWVKDDERKRSQLLGIMGIENKSDRGSKEILGQYMVLESLVCKWMRMEEWPFGTTHMECLENCKSGERTGMRPVWGTEEHGLHYDENY